MPAKKGSFTCPIVDIRTVPSMQSVLNAAARTSGTISIHGYSRGTPIRRVCTGERPGPASSLYSPWSAWPSGCLFRSISFSSGPVFPQPPGILFRCTGYAGVIRFSLFSRIFTFCHSGPSYLPPLIPGGGTVPGLLSPAWNGGRLPLSGKNGGRHSRTRSGAARPACPGPFRYC